jgi:superfamily II DNA or RNA helicase
MFILAVTPARRLVLEQLAEKPTGAGWCSDELAAALQPAFAESAAAGLLFLATDAMAQAAVLPTVFTWWRTLPERLLTELCHLPEGEAPPLLWPPPDGLVPGLLENRPPFAGAEYVDAAMLATLWDELAGLAQERAKAAKLPATDWVRRLGGSWGRVGRVWFHLAENPRGGLEQPFAFMATYSTKALAGGKVQFRPLGQALQEYAGLGNKKALSNLLTPVEAAAQQLPWVNALVASSEIFHPLAWTADEAKAFLDSIPALDNCGILTRLPQKWLRGPPRVQARAKVGQNPAKARIGNESVLDFNIGLALGDETLSETEAAAILSGTGGLVLLRGQWVEVDREALVKALELWKQRENGEVTLPQAMRLLAGLDGTPAASGWAEVQAGDWLAKRLEELRRPETLAAGGAIAGLQAELRPYQKTGVQWLRFVSGIGIGGCLADDMGLGKTVQVLALLLIRRQEAGKGKINPSLLVVPASLLANWLAEAAKFAPSLKIHCAHPAFGGIKAPEQLEQLDAVLTTYGMLHRTPWLEKTHWGLAVIDEAQAIKNPGTRQTQAVKSLRAETRLAMTGTPVENRLGDLWSIFDFLNPGLLGKQKEFDKLTTRLEESGGYAPLRRLVAPYILRRMKTDKAIIADLPDKVEAKAWCGLSKRQAALYGSLVEQFERELLGIDEGIQRRGLILSYLLRFKQLCNHPSQWLGDSAYVPEDSGKFGRLRDLAEEIASRQEKVLVFTQFREMAEPLHRFLGGVFGRPGLILHGGTAVKQRQELVKAFQEDSGPPYFVLSVKAGGVGLNLTAASQVIHFDRWWNPAVENQATDRAFRIGQRRNVMVHKFICQGTIEEKIDRMIEEKQAVAREVVGDGAGEILLTELDNRQILDLVRLDLAGAAAEEE